MAKARNAERRGKFDERITAEPGAAGGGGDGINDVVALVDDVILASATVITSSMMRYHCWIGNSDRLCALFLEEEWQNGGAHTQWVDFRYQVNGHLIWRSAKVK